MTNARKKPRGNSDISTEDQLLKKIQPGLEERERVLDPRHALCFEERAAEVDLTKIREALKRAKKVRKPCTADIYQRKMKEARGREGKGKREDEEGEAEKEERMEMNGEDEDAIERDARIRDETTTGQPAVTENRQRKRMRKKSRGKRKDTRRESEGNSDCESICSFDSDVCLAGVTLTVGDKKEIEDNRRRVQDSGAGAGKSDA